MAGVRFSFLKCLRSSSVKGSVNVELIQSHRHVMNLTRYADRTHVRFPSNSVNQAYSKEELQLPVFFPRNQFRTLTSENSNLLNIKSNASYPPKFSSFCFNSALPFASMTHLLNHRSYSSSLSGKGSGDEGKEVSANFGASDMNASSDSIGGSDWVDKINSACQSAVDTVTHTGQKVKEASDELTPYAQQLLDSHPYLNDVVIPVGGTLTATLIAWIVMPRILRKFHKYAMQGPAALFPGGISREKIPYEKSFWGALEDPVRYLVTFMAFSQMLVIYVHFKDVSFLFLFFSCGVHMFYCVTDNFDFQWCYGSSNNYSLTVP